MKIKVLTLTLIALFAISTSAMSCPTWMAPKSKFHHITGKGSFNFKHQSNNSSHSKIHHGNPQNKFRHVFVKVKNHMKSHGRSPFIPAKLAPKNKHPR